MESMLGWPKRHGGHFITPGPKVTTILDIGLSKVRISLLNGWPEIEVGTAQPLPLNEWRDRLRISAPTQSFCALSEWVVSHYI